MVVRHNFQDILDASLKSSALNLPLYKENPLEIHFEKSDDCKVVDSGPQPSLPFAQSEVFHARISDWRRLTAVNESCKAVYEVTLDITSSNLQFKPGDTIGVIPHNRATEVDSIISHLDLCEKADLSYGLTVDRSQVGAKLPTHVPVNSTLRHVLTHCLDIRSVLKKLFILALSRHTKDEHERRALEYICSKEGSTIYTTHILNQNLCLLDVFTIFKTCKPPIQVILSNLPRLLPRPYSIANSRLKDPNIIKICFSVMDIGNNRRGLTSGWLEDVILNERFTLENGFKNLNITVADPSYDHEIPIYMRKNMSGFSMPHDLETPLILFGPGTGVAPFLGFLQEKEVLKRMDSRNNCGKIWLFFGCRDPGLDFIYERELNDFVLNGTLDKLSTAFSRVENNGIKYTQDALIQNGAEVVKLIKNGASIYVCGDHKTMALQVKAALEGCFIKYDNMSREEAVKFLCDMEKRKTYLIDIWS